MASSIERTAVVPTAIRGPPLDSCKLRTVLAGSHALAVNVVVLNLVDLNGVEGADADLQGEVVEAGPGARVLR